MVAGLLLHPAQGLCPLKLQPVHEGVTVTPGLPFPRPSPDRGTAFEIAGRDRARPDSMIAAIRLAVELAQADAPARSSRAKSRDPVELL